MKVVILLQVQKQQWCVLLLFLLLAAAVVAPPPPIAKLGCSDKCGDVSVPYPFGINNNPACFKNKDFELTCVYADGIEDYRRRKTDGLWLGGFEIRNISVEAGTATTTVFMATSCYNKSVNQITVNDSSVNLEGTPFTFSSKKNKFTALGCNTKAIMVEGNGTRFSSGCMSLCYKPVDLTNEGGCSGVGCCRTQIPNGVKILNYTLEFENDYDYEAFEFSPCSIAFLADQDWNDFTSFNLTDESNIPGVEPPAALDWVVGNDTCESFSHNSNESSDYACTGANTYCNNSYNGPGYLCFCKTGYEGNPYLPQGCQDVDECMSPERYKCEGRCKNTVGSYTCHCPLGMSGDGKVGCKGFRLSTLGTVVGVGLSLVVAIFFLWMECKRRSKARNFRKNGGSLLKHQKIKIFKEEELKKATRNYDAAQLLGQGGSGSVYKGVLPDNSLVAIKKPNVDVDITRRIRHLRSREEMNNEFQHEIGMICQVKHRNVVKLLGLCLETNVPILVYEFISNGTLFEHIHIARSSILNSWKNRLRIAFETAVALDYLHSTAGTPIIHRDVKSMNILLDENLTAKVADFGASVLIPLEQTSINTKIQGTKGYLDPEYLITGNLTVKSDVYGFGVVLMELLTSQKPIISNERSGEEKVNFIQHFISSVEQGNLGEVLNAGRFEDCEEEMEQVQVVAELAVKCLNRSGVGRPAMNKVVECLRWLMKLHDKNVGVDQSNIDIEEKESLLGGGDHHHSAYRNDISCSSSSFEITQYMTTTFDTDRTTS